MVAVALVTALAVELAYQVRVSLQIAANGRDALKAEAQARGAVALSRLMLHLQVKLDKATDPASMQGLGGLGALAGGGQLPAIPRPQLWKLVPVTSQLADNLFGGADGAGGPVPPPTLTDAPAPPKPPDGQFDAVIEDEDRKVNAQLDGSASGGQLGGQVEAFAELVADRRFDFLFDREDDNGVKMSRADLAIWLHDWVDDNQAQSALTGNPAAPFEDGFGDENFYYDRGRDRYKAKNARFDSLDELYLVAGIGDAFMGTFGDRLTVYVGRNAQMNINAETRDELLRNARIMARPPNQAAFLDPAFAERLEKAVRELRMGGFVSMTPGQFAGILELLGVSVGTDYTQQSRDKRGAFTDRSKVFRIRGTGTAGQVSKSIEAVVSFDPDQARDDADQLGRPLHWYEE
jgi:general secretion pathway protein K